MSDCALYVVSTPIGNMGDITFRAIEVLKKVELVAAEDTRHSRKLLDHYGIDTHLIPCHDHNERHQTDKILARMVRGDSVALVSDAGTPLIADPGFHLVRRVRAAGLPVISIPGVCAFISALSVSGLPTDRFFFEGFLPAKKSGRCARLGELCIFPHTWGFYESPHRIQECLADVNNILGADRDIVLAREITKVFETIIHGSVAEVQEVLKSDPFQRKGEFVVLVDGFKLDTEAVSVEAEKMLKRLMVELPLNKAAAVVADLLGCRKRVLYEAGLRIKVNN